MSLTSHVHALLQTYISTATAVSLARVANTASGFVVLGLHHRCTGELIGPSNPAAVLKAAVLRQLRPIPMRPTFQPYWLLPRTHCHYRQHIGELAQVSSPIDGYGSDGLDRKGDNDNERSQRPQFKLQIPLKQIRPPKQFPVNDTTRNKNTNAIAWQSVGCQTSLKKLAK